MLYCTLYCVLHTVLCTVLYTVLYTLMCTLKYIISYIRLYSVLITVLYTVLHSYPNNIPLGATSTIWIAIGIIRYSSQLVFYVLNFGLNLALRLNWWKLENHLMLIKGHFVASLNEIYWVLHGFKEICGGCDLPTKPGWTPDEPSVSTILMLNNRQCGTRFNAEQGDFLCA